MFRDHSPGLPGTGRAPADACCPGLNTHGSHSLGFLSLGVNGWPLVWGCAESRSCGGEASVVCVSLRPSAPLHASSPVPDSTQRAALAVQGAVWKSLLPLLRSCAQSFLPKGFGEFCVMDLSKKMDKNTLPLHTTFKRKCQRKKL